MVLFSKSKPPLVRHRAQLCALPESRSRAGFRSQRAPKAQAKKRAAPKVAAARRAQQGAKTPPFLPPLDSTIWKPVPVAKEEADQALLVGSGGSTDFSKLAEQVWEGQSVLFTRRWTDVLKVKKALNTLATERLCHLDSTAEANRERRRLLRNCARRLFAEVAVSTGELKPKGGPPLGYVPLLYDGSSRLFSCQRHHCAECGLAVFRKRLGLQLPAEQASSFLRCLLHSVSHRDLASQITRKSSNPERVALSMCQSRGALPAATRLARTAEAQQFLACP